MQAEDLVTMPRLGAPSVSADETLAVFPVTLTDPETYARSSKLHVRSLTDMDAMPVEVALGGQAHEFSGDGYLYYLDTDADSTTAQVWRTKVNRDGSVGARQQVTDFERSVDGFTVADDGARIAVWASLPRTCETFDCTEASAEAPAPVGSGRLYDGGSGFYRHWDRWIEPGTYNRVFAFPVTNGVASGAGVAVDGPAQAGGPTGNTPTMPFGGAEDVSFAPD